jgi:hypothetical protein
MQIKFHLSKCLNLCLILQSMWTWAIKGLIRPPLILHLQPRAQQETGKLRLPKLNAAILEGNPFEKNEHIDKQ